MHLLQQIARTVATTALLFAAAGLSAFASSATLVADTHVSTAQPSLNFGTLTNLDVGNGYTSLVQFDLGSLPSGTTAGQVARATLRLYVNRVDTPGGLAIQPVLASWGEYSLTQSTLPTLGTVLTVTPVSQAGAFLTVDLTALVQGWITAPATNFGLALTAGTAVLQLDSKENDLTSHPAELEITLVSQGPAGVAGTAGAQGPAGPAGAQGPSGASGPAGSQGPAGLTGAQGPAGPQGPAGVQGPAGTAAVINYQGLWSSLTSYPANAVVSYAGSSYLSLSVANKGNTPGLASSSWGLLAAAGSSAAASSGSGSLVYQGTYASSLNYALGDIVQYLGSSYVSLIASNHGNTPGFVAAAWGLLASAQAGAPGPVGPGGPAGSIGPVGPAGPAGPQGAPGPAGAGGPQGSPGLVYRGSYSSVANYALGDVVLWQGVTYTSLSASNHGNAPDLVSAEWGVLATEGPAGPAGPQGQVGLTGPQGFQGLVGPPGPAGPQGSIGSEGPAGAQGLPGVQGSRGDTGAQGLQGLPGQAGAQGIAGTPGLTGPPGATGPEGPAGPAGLTPLGTYDSTRNYGLADAVTFNGSGYVSLIAGNLGHTPGQSPGQWSLFAAAGAPGAVGPAGPEGVVGASGPAGPAGPQGATGPGGATGAQGPAGASFQGPYNPQNSYLLSDVVTYAGSSWISLLSSNHGNTPDQSPGQWAVLAAKGSNGATGGVGPAGPAGPAGATGATGPAGPGGPQGITGTAGAPGLNFRGTWAANLNYAVNDGVSWQGASWIAVASSMSVAPDSGGGAWSLLAAAGAAGAAGQAGAIGSTGSAATISIGSVTTGADPAVTNSGTSSAAIFNFVLPAASSGGTGSGTAAAGTSGVPFESTIHAVVFGTTFYSVSNSTSAGNEAGPVLTWVPGGCTATKLTVYSMQANPITVTLRSGTPGSMQPTGLACQVSNSSSCTVQGSVTITAGTFLDLGILGANGTASSVWTAVACN